MTAGLFWKRGGDCGSDRDADIVLVPSVSSGVTAGGIPSACTPMISA